MRIAFVTTSYPTWADDAAGHFVRAERLEREREGHDVVVIAPRAGGAFGWPGVVARVRERPLRAFEAGAWIARARMDLARVGHVDRVVAHWAVPCAWPIALAATRDVQLEIVSHGGDVRLLTRLPRLAREGVVSSLARRARTWRFVSERLYEELASKLSRDARARVDRIACIRPAAVEMPDVAGEAARKRAALQREGSLAVVAVTVARLVPSKRIDQVIEHATAHASRLVVVGDGPERPRLEALARSRGVDARFVGQVARSEALAWIAAADVLLHASLHEGLSTVIREAEALGTPVIRLA